MKILVCTLLLGASLSCADTAHANAWWINLGGGVGAPGESFDDPFSVLASVSCQFGKPVVTLRYAGVGDLLGDDRTDVGLLAGIGKTTPKTLVSIAAGLAYARRTRSGGDFPGDTTSENVDTALGVPVEIQLFVRPFDNGSQRISGARDVLGHLGIGIYGFADFNSEGSFGGLAFCVQFGAFR